LAAIFPLNSPSRVALIINYSTPIHRARDSTINYYVRRPMDSTTREGWFGIAINSRDFCPYNVMIERVSMSGLIEQRPKLTAESKCSHRMCNAA
jgi:hypothetical protein